MTGGKPTGRQRIAAGKTRADRALHTPTGAAATVAAGLAARRIGTQLITRPAAGPWGVAAGVLRVGGTAVREVGLRRLTEAPASTGIQR